MPPETEYTLSDIRELLVHALTNYPFNKKIEDLAVLPDSELMELWKYEKRQMH